MTSLAHIAHRLRLQRSGREWRGTCPACGGAGAFVLTTDRMGRAHGWCASCQDRDAIARGALRSPREDNSATRERRLCSRSKHINASAYLCARYAP
jgi:hypothetical protein